jgi:hypothetical protein
VAQPICADQAIQHKTPGRRIQGFVFSAKATQRENQSQTKLTSVNVKTFYDCPGIDRKGRPRMAL